MKQDEYGEVINSPETYKDIADNLRSGGAVLIGWSDGDSHYDILFNYGVIFEPSNMPTIQGGIKAHDLFISVMRIGAFGFSVDRTSNEHYYREKLGYCDAGLEALFNGVREALKS